MYIHEFQDKDLLAARGIPLPNGRTAGTVDEAAQAAAALGGTAWAIKAQVHAGARGRAGGVRLAASPSEVTKAATDLLGARLVTDQTGAAGATVKQVYVEEACDIDRELYLMLFVDRSVGRVAVMASAHGGGGIEQLAAASPDRLLTLHIDPVQGPDRGELLAFARRLELSEGQRDAAANIIEALYRAFVELDANLIEINPLAVTPAGDLIALDVKMGFDDNALFRHPDIEALRDQEEADPQELAARRSELNFVKLEGEIGCMVTGAGLALATHDILKQLGGEPADFMDIRPVATRAQIAFGFKLLLANPKVKAILVNIYGGGIMRCDTIAEAIASAVKEGGLGVPLVVRAAGTNKEICKKVLTGQGIDCAFVDDIAAAAKAAIAAARREAA
jgi:succinyl-CoA synthetase beta subunit